MRGGWAGGVQGKLGLKGPGGTMGFMGEVKGEGEARVKEGS